MSCNSPGDCWRNHWTADSAVSQCNWFSGHNMCTYVFLSFFFSSCLKLIILTMTIPKKNHGTIQMAKCVFFFSPYVAISRFSTDCSLYYQLEATLIMRPAREMRNRTSSSRIVLVSHMGYLRELKLYKLQAQSLCQSSHVSSS